jgi:hypothetical protein
MKYILTQTNQTQLGPFTTVQETDVGYMCDDSLYPTSIYGQVTESEVPDDYMTPDQIINYNNQQSELREVQYKLKSDPINFQYQAGVKTKQEWLDARAAIQAEYPYKV